MQHDQPLPVWPEQRQLSLGLSSSSEEEEDPTPSRRRSGGDPAPLLRRRPAAISPVGGEESETGDSPAPASDRDIVSPGGGGVPDVEEVLASEDEEEEEDMLSLKYLRMRAAYGKLADPFLGPFEIITRAGNNTYKLKLPPKYGLLHPTFHVSLLEPYVRREGAATPEPMNIEDDQ